MININYFKYLLKKDYKIILILFLGIFFLFPLQVIIDEPIYNEIWYSYNESEYIVIGEILSFSSLCLTSSTIIILILGIFTPLVMRHMYITRKQCDTYYALPIKKETLYQTTYLFGFVVDTLNGSSFSPICNIPFPIFFIAVSVLFIIPPSESSLSTIINFPLFSIV